MKHDKVRTCRVCGCTDMDACFNEDMGFCWWAGEDLCSHCDPETVAMQSGLVYDIANSLKPVSTIPGALIHPPSRLGLAVTGIPSREGTKGWVDGKNGANKNIGDAI